MKKMLSVVLVIAIFIIAVMIFRPTSSTETASTRDIELTQEEDTIIEPPVMEGICHGILCDSYEENTGKVTCPMVMLKDYSKLKEVIYALFEVKTMEDFEKVAENEELTTVGYFLHKANNYEELVVEDEYKVIIKGEEYLCKRIHDNRIDVVPLPGLIFSEDAGLQRV